MYKKNFVDQKRNETSKPNRTNNSDPKRPLMGAPAIAQDCGGYRQALSLIIIGQKVATGLRRSTGRGNNFT
jgi:hypothetical protein